MYSPHSPAVAIAVGAGLSAGLVVAILGAGLKSADGGDRGPKLRWIVVVAAAISLLQFAGILAGVLGPDTRAQLAYEGLAGLVAVASISVVSLWIARRTPLTRSVQVFGYAGIVAGVVHFGVGPALIASAFSAPLPLPLGLVAGFAFAALGGVVALCVYGVLRTSTGTAMTKVTGVVAIIFGGGVLAASIGDMQSACYPAAIDRQIWNMTQFADPGAGGLSGFMAAGLRATVGYEPQPSIVQVASFGVYLAVMLTAFTLLRSRRNGLS